MIELSKEARELCERSWQSFPREALAALDSAVAEVARIRGNFLELERRFDKTCATLGTVGEKFKAATASAEALKSELDSRATERTETLATLAATCADYEAGRKEVERLRAALERVLGVAYAATEPNGECERCGMQRSDCQQHAQGGCNDSVKLETPQTTEAPADKPESGGAALGRSLGHVDAEASAGEAPDRVALCYDVMRSPPMWMATSETVYTDYVRADIFDEFTLTSTAAIGKVARERDALNAALARAIAARNESEENKSIKRVTNQDTRAHEILSAFATLDAERARHAAELAETHGALRALVDALPRCTQQEDPTDLRTTCKRPAMRALMRGGARYCDEHGTSPDEREVPEYPRARPLRGAVALLERVGG